MRSVHVIEPSRPALKHATFPRVVRGVAAAVILALTMSGLAPTAALADGPVAPSIPWFDPHDPAAQPTAAERRVLAQKNRQYEHLLAAHQSWMDKNCTSGVCPMAGDPGGGGFPYSVVLNVAALQQQYCNWCGPATTQAVQYWMNNFQWATAQSTIASSEGTCFPPNNCGTIVYRNRQGLNSYVSPLPAHFIYWEYQTTSSGDWWGKIQTDIAFYYMPQIATVAPHDINAALWLPDWATAVDAGHYIVVDGYWGYSYTGASVQYEDSSSGCMGNTGRYSTSSATMYYVIMRGSNNHPSNWIIW